MRRINILVVDDDPTIGGLLEDCLESEGWGVYPALSGEEAIKFFDRDPTDLVILDIMLPHMTGEEVFEYLRKLYSVPIIMLSALSDENEKVKYLTRGAHDYITKPFRTRELVARIKIVLQHHDRESSIEQKSIKLDSGIEIDFERRRVIREGKETGLTPVEYRLLRELVVNSGKVMTSPQLLRRVWGPEYKDETQYIYVRIGSLRAKLEPDPKNPQYIITVPDTGYVFRGKVKVDGN